MGKNILGEGLTHKKRKQILTQTQILRACVYLTVKAYATHHTDFIRASVCMQTIRTNCECNNRPIPLRKTPLTELTGNWSSPSSQDGIYNLYPCAHQPPHPESPPSLLGLGGYTAGIRGPEHPKRMDIRDIPDSGN